MEYNTQNKKTKTEVPRLEDGQVGVRATLNNMGFSDNAIGYDENSGAVTLNGKALLKPGHLDHDAGVSYAKEEDIQKSVENFYRNSGNPVVRVSDAYAGAAGKYGLSADALSYGNGTVSIGGRPLEILYIDREGKSWARQNTVSDAVERYAGTVGVQSPSALAEEYANTYLRDAKDLYRRLYQQKSFSYNPEEDPVFLAYQSKYRREGERAGKEAAANLAALTGGYTNSAAATAGAQAQQYYAQQLSDTIPDLAQQAYERYIKKYQTDLDLLNSMVDIYDTVYGHAVKANETQRDNANAVVASNVARDENAKEQAWQEKKNQQEYAKAQQDAYWDEILNGLEAEKNQYENENLQLTAMQKQIYQQYYRWLLQEELTGAQLDNQKKRKQLGY